MCTAPITIPNPYFNRGFTLESLSGDRVRVQTKGRFDYLHDTIHSHISVPCGRCSQCLSMRQGFLNQRVQMESLRSEVFFMTLTYANRALPFAVIGDYRVHYPKYSDIQNCFKRVKKELPCRLRSFVVSEYGKKGRPHFHSLLFIEKDDIKKFFRGSHLYCEKVLFRLFLKHWKRRVNRSTKYPMYVDLCDFVVKGKKRSFDLHWVEPIVNHDNDLSFYLTKYMLKYSPSIEKLLTKIKLDSSLSDEQTKTLLNFVKPRAYASKDLGSYKDSRISNYITSCVARSTEYPSYFDLNTGKSMLLSPYYRSRFVTISDKFDKWWNYVMQLQLKNYDDPRLLDSYNPELLKDDIVYDLNCIAVKSFNNDRHLKKVKYLLSKK